MKIWKLMMFQTFGKEPTEDELNRWSTRLSRSPMRSTPTRRPSASIGKGAGDATRTQTGRKTNKTYSCASVLEVAMRLNCPTVTQEQRKP